MPARLSKNLSDKVKPADKDIVERLRELIRAWNDFVDSGAAGLVSIRVDSGAVVGSRSILNLLTGDGVSISATDDSADGEVEITISGDVTTEALDIYVDAVDGDDTNDGFTSATPVQTWVHAESLIPTVVRHAVRVHLAAGTYPVNRTWLFRARVVQGDGRITTYADDAWDSTVYTTILAGTAGASTTADVVKTSGLTINAHRGYWLEMTDGDAAGQRRTIRNNTATDLVPSVSFGVLSSAAPASGDAFKVFTSAVHIAPVPAGGFSLVQNQAIDGYRGPGGGEVVTSYVLQGLVFENTGDVYIGGYTVATDTTFYGVRLEDELRVDCAAVLECGDSTLNSPTDENVLGWGVTQVGGYSGYIYTQRNGRIQGTAVTAHLGGSGWISAGYIGDCWLSVDSVHDSMTISGYWGLVSPLIGPVHVYPGHRIWLNYVDFDASVAPLVDVVAGGTVMLSFQLVGSSSGGTTVQVRGGGQIVCLVAPSLGDAAASDWDVGDGMPFNKSAVVSGFNRSYEGRLVTGAF